MMALTARSVCLVLQSELQSKALPKGTNTPRKRTFFKQSELRALLTQSRVTELLRCRCSSCSFWWKAAEIRCSDDDLDNKVQEIIGQSKQQQASVLILSLLILNACSPLIITFINKSCHDEEMRRDLEKFSAEYFDRIFLPQAGHPDQLSTSLSEDKWRIFPPVIDDLLDNGRLTLPAEAVLPFTNDKKIGEGAYGVVFCSEVPNEYVKITVCPSSMPCKIYVLISY